MIIVEDTEEERRKHCFDISGGHAGDKKQEKRGVKEVIISWIGVVVLAIIGLLLGLLSVICGR